MPLQYPLDNCTEAAGVGPTARLVTGAKAPVRATFRRPDDRAYHPDQPGVDSVMRSSAILTRKLGDDLSALRAQWSTAGDVWGESCG